MVIPILHNFMCCAKQQPNIVQSQHKYIMYIGIDTIYYDQEMFVIDNYLCCSEGLAGIYSN